MSHLESTLHARIWRMYRDITQHDGQPPTRLGCNPKSTQVMAAVTHDFSLPLTIEPDDECEPDLIWLK